MYQVDAIEGVYDGCRHVKQHWDPFPKQSHLESKLPLDLLHTDLCSFQIPSLWGYNHFIKKLDDFIKKTLAYFYKEKHEALKALKDFKSQVKKFSGFQITNLRSDWACKYLSKLFEGFCKENDIRHALAVRHTL